jgi:uncharacterized protein YciI
MAFLYRLIAPRPTFAQDMTDAERAAMAEHAEYLRGKLDEGVVVAFGPVADPAGAWGLGLIDVDDEAGARAVGDADPAVTSGTCTYEVVPMLALVHGK